MMPKLPVLSGREMVKTVAQLGYEFRRQKGSHVILKNGPKRLTIPLHPALKTGTLLQILREMGISREQLIDML